MKTLRAIVSTQLFWVTLIFASIMVGAYYDKKPQPVTHEEYLAQTTLLTNHRLLDGDIAEAGWPHKFFSATLTTRDDFIGRYVETCVEKDYPLTLDKTHSGPDLITKRNKAIVWIPLADVPASEVATLDVGHQLVVCNVDGNERCAKYAAEAIACTGKDPATATCSAAIQIGIDRLARFFKTLEKAGAAKNDATAKPEATPTPQGQSPIHATIYHSAEPQATSSPTALPSSGPNAPTPEPSPSPSMCPTPTPAPKWKPASKRSTTPRRARIR